MIQSYSEIRVDERRDSGYIQKERQREIERERERWRGKRGDEENWYRATDTNRRK